MTQTELTRMKAWLLQNAEKYMVFVPECGASVYGNASLAEDFYNHFKDEVR